MSARTVADAGVAMVYRPDADRGSVEAGADAAVGVEGRLVAGACSKEVFEQRIQRSLMQMEAVISGQPVFRLWDVRAYVQNARDLVLVPTEYIGAGKDARIAQLYTVISHTWAQDLRAFTRLLVAKGRSDCPGEDNSYPAMICRGQRTLQRAVSINDGFAVVRDATWG